MKHFRLFPTHLWEHEVAEKKHLNKRIVNYVLEQDTHKKNWQSKSTMYKLKEFDVLNKNASEVKISDILLAVDEKIKTIGCKRHSKQGCNGRSSKCITHDFWDELENYINDFFKKKNLEDLINQTKFN